MALGDKDTVQRSGRKKEKETVETRPDGACRCKETAEMTPRELLKLMMKDLAFWKKEKKD